MSKQNTDILLDELERLENEIDCLSQINEQHRAMNGRLRDDIEEVKEKLYHSQLLVNDLTKLIFTTNDEELIEKAKKLRGVKKEWTL